MTVENDQGNDPVETDNSPTLVDKANAAVDRMKVENDRHEALVKRAEALRVEQTLGGTSTAGVPAKKEETPKEYADRVMRNEL